MTAPTTFRYAERLSAPALADGRWVEKGVISRDGGTTWMPFFEMTLSRKR